METLRSQVQSRTAPPIGALVALAVAVLLLGLGAAPAPANIGGLFPTDDDGNTAIESIRSDQNLWVYTVSDVQGGDVCVVSAAFVLPGDGSATCKHPAWGTKNRIGATIGSSWHLIEVPFLRPGTWRLLADGGSKDSVDVLSDTFTVEPCAPAGCDTSAALAVAADYKAAAGNMAAAMEGMAEIEKQMAKRQPGEPFGTFRDRVLKPLDKLEKKLPKYVRMRIDDIGALQSFRDLPAGPEHMAMYLLTTITGDALAMYKDIVADPPLPYDTVTPPSFDEYESTGDAATDALMTSLAKLNGYGAAGLTAYERLQGAEGDANGPGMHRQAAAMAADDAAAAEQMYQSADGLEALAQLMHASADFSGLALTQDDVDAWRPIQTRLASSGFTAAERQQLVDAGLDDEEIGIIKDAILAMKLDETPVGVTIEDELTSVADALRNSAPAFDAMANGALAIAQTSDTPPVAGFTVAPPTGTAPVEMAFSDTATDADSGDTLTISWDFGDGATAAGTPGGTVHHTFTTPGTYSVTETVDDGTTSATLTQQVAVQDNVPPTPAFTVTPAQGGEAPLDIRVDASDSNDADGSIASYAWDFGDGGHAAGKTASHRYPGPGDYTVTLTVTDDKGAQASSQTGVAVTQPVPPSATDDTLPVIGHVGVLDVLANDSAPNGDASLLRVSGATQPQHGAVSCRPLGDCRYVGAAGYTGADGFDYTVRGANGLTATAHVALDVQPAPADPVALVARDDHAATTAGKPVDIDVLANDTSPDTLAIVNPEAITASHGTVACSASGPCTYTPDAGFGGVDGFRYTIADAAGDTAAAGVTIRVANQDAGFAVAVGGAARQALTQGDVAHWAVAVRPVPAGADQDALQALPAPVVGAKLGGAQKLVSGSVHTAKGWTADPVAAGDDHVTARAGAAALLGAASTAIPRPLPPVSQGTGGDSHVPILIGDKVYGVFHITSPTSVTCVDRATGRICPKYPRSLPFDPGLAPGPGAVVGQRIFLHLLAPGRTGQNDPYMLVCWDTESAEPCGLTVLARAAAPLAGAAPLAVAGQVWGAAGDGRLYCLDPATQAPCATPSIDTGLGAAPSGTSVDAVTHGTRIFVTYGTGTVGCVDVVDGGRCAGWSQGKDLGVTAPSSPNVVTERDAAGHAVGVCLIAGSDGRCVRDDAPGKTTSLAGWPNTDDGYSYTLEGEAGHQTYVGNIGRGGLGCWDWAALAPCTGQDYGADGWISQDVQGIALPDAYGASFDGTCIVGLGDAGLVFTVDPASGTSPCTRLGGAGQTVDLRDQRCDGGVGLAAWTGVALADSAAGELASVVVTVRDAATHQVLATGDIARGTLDLSAIDAAAHPALTVEAAATSTSGDVAWADAIPPRIRLTWTPDPQQLCFDATTAPDCLAALAPLRVDATLTPAAASAFDEATLRRAPCPPVLALGDDRRVDEGSPLSIDASAPDPNGDAVRYALVAAPAGAAIDAVSGRISWTPSEAQGPSHAVLRVRVTDPGGLHDERTVGVDVAEVNAAPALAPLPDVSAAAGRPLAVTATASDPDLPANGLRFALTQAPDGATIDPASGRISWAAPTAGDHAITVSVADDGTPALSASRTFTVHVAGPAAGQGAQLLLSCSHRRLVLEDVIRRGGRVQLLGVADPSLAGRTVAITFAATGKVVARPVIGPDGRFATTAPLPPARLRSGNRARYQAQVGADRSLALKLARRLLVDRVRAAAGRVTITGRVLPPLAPRAGDRTIVIQRLVSCAKARQVAKATPRAGGAFSITFADADPAAAVYRLQTSVRTGGRASRTFSLPRTVG